MKNNTLLTLQKFGALAVTFTAAIVIIYVLAWCNLDVQCRVSDPVVEAGVIEHLGDGLEIRSLEWSPSPTPDMDFPNIDTERNDIHFSSLGTRILSVEDNCETVKVFVGDTTLTFIAEPGQGITGIYIEGDPDSGIYHDEDGMPHMVIGGICVTPKEKETS